MPIVRNNNIDYMVRNFHLPTSDKEAWFMMIRDNYGRGSDYCDSTLFFNESWSGTLSDVNSGGSLGLICHRVWAHIVQTPIDPQGLHHFIAGIVLIVR